MKRQVFIHETWIGPADIVGEDSASKASMVCPLSTIHIGRFPLSNWIAMSFKLRRQDAKSIPKPIKYIFLKERYQTRYFTTIALLVPRLIPQTLKVRYQYRV